MATIFLSYRRTDAPQASRVYEWLTRRFGNDAVFMDVSAIPFAVSFPDYIRDAIAKSKILIALIGADWAAKLEQPEDPVRLEIETALASHVPVLPVLIGNAAMPVGEDLPPSIAPISYQNALTVGVLRDFDTHMRSLVPEIESILGSLSRETLATANPEIIRFACSGIMEFLRDRHEGNAVTSAMDVDWTVLGTTEFNDVDQRNRVTLFLHRIVALEELLELHFILSFWAHFAQVEQVLAGAVMRELEQTPVVPDRFIAEHLAPAPGCEVKIRRSDEDPRQIWRMITDMPLRLSLAYIATVSPKL